MAGSILGEQVLRKEDPKFLTTGGEYLADISEPLLEGAAHVVFARSPMAHGMIESIDISEAESMPGVIGIYTADSLGLEPTKSNFNPGVARTLLASDKVRWVGEPIVAVVAETYAQATDAAQMVFVDIDPLPAVIDMREALTSSTHIYDGAGSSAVFDSAAFGGQPTTGDAFFEGCEVVVSTEALNQRVAPCPLEPRPLPQHGMRVASTSGFQPSMLKVPSGPSRAPMVLRPLKSGSLPQTLVAVSVQRLVASQKNFCSDFSRRKAGGQSSLRRPAASR